MNMKIRLGAKKKVVEEKEEKEEPSNGNKIDKTLNKSSWMKTGFQAASKEIANNKAKRGSYTPDFWLKNGEEANVRFISSEPVCIYQHRFRNGTRWNTSTCLGEHCPMCEGGNKKQFVGVFSVIDRRKEQWIGKDSKEVKRENTVKMWRCGTRIMGSLERLTAKRGSLMGYDINVERRGESTDTVYTLLPDEPTPMSAEDKAKKPLDLITLLAPKQRAELLAGINAGKHDDEEVAETF